MEKKVWESISAPIKPAECLSCPYIRDLNGELSFTVVTRDWKAQVWVWSAEKKWVEVICANFEKLDVFDTNNNRTCWIGETFLLRHKEKYDTYSLKSGQLSTFDVCIGDIVMFRPTLFHCCKREREVVSTKKQRKKSCIQVFLLFLLDVVLL
ncbi:hypothetical protein AMTRI_Chr07g24630 [Amborella trichopoda]